MALETDGDVEKANISHADTTPVIQHVQQSVPLELGTLTKEVLFVLVCTSGQLWFTFLMGDVNVNQARLSNILNFETTQLPWLNGSFGIAIGLTVIIFGSLSDLVPPKRFMVGALAWLSLWSLIAVFSLTPARKVLFFVTRAMQGLSVGVLVSGSMSILGRVYNPGQRKTRVFSIMATAAPIGFCVGALQGGALSFHLKWLFGMNAILAGLFCIGAAYALPALKPAADDFDKEAPGLRSFDLMGAACAATGCVCIIFGLTQGPAANWSPYTYAIIIVGVASLALFFWVESKANRPLIPNRLWRTRGFAPLMAAYFLGFGAYVGPWQFYAIDFWLRIQHRSALTVSLYLLPNLVAGVIATFTVNWLLHKVPGHYIYIAAMVAYAAGPALFLPQNAHSNYWALSMPGIFLTVFGPDLSFAAASIFITSNVPRSYQGSAGSLLVTIQNMSSAVMTSAAGAIGAGVGPTDDGQFGLQGIKAAWWLGLGAAIAGAIITVLFIRIPKEEEGAHVVDI